MQKSNIETTYFDNDVLTLDPGPHSYTFNGRPVDSVTQILDGVFEPFKMLSPEDLAYYGSRGTATHKMTELVDKGTLNLETLAPEIVGRHHAYLLFLDEHFPEMIQTEFKIVNKLMGYVGTLDRILKLHGKTGVLDVKSGIDTGTVGMQTAGYGEAYFKGKKHWRWGLFLRDNGTYKLTPYTDKGDYADFLATQRVWRIKKRLNK